uniref:Uncharacterized protein n=1 Tax=Strongyloides venezuelensis TaxID=75913 RepID=A0A0K0F2M0_STRVS
MFQIKVPIFDGRKSFLTSKVLLYSIFFIMILSYEVCTKSMFYKVSQRSDSLVLEENGTSPYLDDFTKENCDIYRDKQFHVIVDTVCEACHEMFSQTFPNLRAQCRSNCFRNENFSSCLKIFKPNDFFLN